MSQCLRLLAVLAIAALAGAASPVCAEYPRNGAILTNPSSYFYSSAMISSGRGGAIVAWCEGPSDAMDVFAQRVGPLGELLWPPEGVVVSGAADDQFSPVISPDGEGGAIIVWTDQRGTTGTHLYAQRIDSAGAVLWAEDGVPVCTAAPGEQLDERILLCAGGDFIVTWEDSRSGQYDIYAQRFDGGGNPLWTIDGVAICAAANDQNVPDIVSDDAGGAIIAWEDRRDGNGDIYAQRIDAAGNPLWAANGFAACTDGADQTEPRIATNMIGGAFIAWTDYRTFGSPNAQVYIQNIGADGYGLWFFSPDGAYVATSEYNESTPRIVSDGAGGAIVAWWQDVPGAAGARAQRISEGAQSLWGSYGIPLCNANIDSDGLRIAPDGEGGVFAAWMDYRGGSADVYVQRVDADGNILWSPNGTNICSGPAEIQNIEMAPDESGGIVVTWLDDRFANHQCAYAQRMNADGWWGNPEPGILSCLDVPEDEGGFVRVRLAASSHDVALERDYPVDGYNAWRRIGGSGGGGGGALAAAETPALEREKLGGFMAECLETPLARLSGAQALALGFPEGEWESIGFHAATRDTLYDFLVPTREDSTENGSAMETYLVTAHATDPGVFVVSNPDSGCSVDNLAPGLTSGFAGNESASPPGLALSWTANGASDLWKYDVHRGDDALFVPDASNLLGTAEGTEYHDGTWVKAYQYFYKLVAVDRHGNASPDALLRPEDINVATLLQSFAARLAGSAMEIAWTLSEADDDVRFAVSRAEARGGTFEELLSPAIARDGLSFTLHDRSVEPGTSYKYRVDVVEESGRRTLFETDEISTPAMPLTLHQNHPNPFNPATTIPYYLPESSVVTLEIYDSSGRLVSRLANGVKEERGMHEAAWRGVDTNGRAVSSGVYFYRLTCGKETVSKKMVLLR